MEINLYYLLLFLIYLLKNFEPFLDSNLFYIILLNFFINPYKFDPIFI